MKKIMMIFGTRPEAIKMAPLYKELKESKEFEIIACVTAQHREMLDQVLEIFDIKPDIDLDIMKNSRDLHEITANVILGIRNALQEVKPDLVLVHGDTTTTFASSLACYYLNIKIGHIEAGLRTYDMTAPFPEEFNRQVTGLLADFHFAPTEESKRNLIKEGKKEETILVTGNTVIDALFTILNKVEENRVLREKIIEDIDRLLDFDWKLSKFVLITGHRRENFGEGFIQITKAIKRLAITHKDMIFVYPVHLNPNVQKPVNDLLEGLENVYLIKPLYYEAFPFLLRHCFFVLTDSGGIQEEAPSLGKPVLVMRDVTERPEAVNAGTVKLIGTSTQNIVENIEELFDNKDLYSQMSKAHNPFGDGKASLRIIDFIKQLR